MRKGASLRSAWLALALAACAPTPGPEPVLGPPPAPAPPAGPSPTRVVRFVPAMPAGTPRDGTCWTVSIAAPRAGAWRCNMGNEIVDPCFTPPSGDDAVVCGADPAAGDAGFVLHLAKPLPHDVPTPTATEAPWLLRLADGQVCRPFTGTVPVVDGKEARWSCASGGVLTRIDVGATWTVEWYPASEAHSGARPSPSRVPPTRLSVTDAWE